MFLLQNIFLIIVEIKHKYPNELVSNKFNSLIFNNCKYSTNNAVSMRTNLMY